MLHTMMVHLVKYEYVYEYVVHSNVKMKIYQENKRRKTPTGRKSRTSGAETDEQRAP